jgi:hypothetical protein
MPDPGETVAADDKPTAARLRAVICDIDETLCTFFNLPVALACRVLTRLDSALAVHYVTARPEELRQETERFLREQRLPGWHNLHLCPRWTSTREHKTRVMQRLAQEYDVLVSIGDAIEDEMASRAAGVPFVRVDFDNTEEAWRQVATLVGLTWTFGAEER